MAEWFLVKRIIRKDGYDVSGCYYGTGNPVFFAEEQSGSMRIREFRACNIARAREIVRERFDKDATFIK